MRPISVVTFWLLVALWTPSADGYPLPTTEAATNRTSNAFRANLETRGSEETGRSEEHTAARAKLASVEEMASAFSTSSYTKSKEPHTLSSPMVASNTRTQRHTLLLSSNPLTAPKETAHSSTAEHKTSDRPQQHSDGLHLGHVTTLTATTQRPPQPSALPATSGEKITLRMNTTSMRATVAKIGATSDQKLSPFSQSTTSSLRDKTTSTNKPQVKSTPGLTTFATHTTTTDIALTTTKLIETTVPSTSTVTTKQISKAIIENNGNGTGTTVAAVIVSAIVVMIVAIAFIMLRKNRRQERNKYNTTWAGPTPFLDGEIQSNIPLGEDDDGGKRQPHKRISVPNFLSGPSSKRESLLKEEQVPMEGLVQGSTFSRPQDNVSPPSNGSVLSDEAQPLGATPTSDPESPSPDTSTKGEDNFGQDPIEDDAITETQPDPPAPLVEVDLEPPPGQEALPPPPSDGPIVPPPPPLPPSTE